MPHTDIDTDETLFLSFKEEEVRKENLLYVFASVLGD